MLPIPGDNNQLFVRIPCKTRTVNAEHAIPARLINDHPMSRATLRLSAIPDFIDTTVPGYNRTWNRSVTMGKKVYSDEFKRSAVEQVVSTVTA